MLKFNNLQDAQIGWRQDRAQHELRGVYVPATAYLPEPFRRNADLAMDAQPGLVTDPDSSIPAMLTTFIDPNIFEVIYAPNKMAEIMGEERKGDWTSDTAMFPVVEQTGEVSSYSDFTQNGRAGINMNWPNFQQYRFQTIIEYGELEMARAGLGKINYASELERAAIAIMNKYENLVYAYGVQGLYNYGLLNNPYLSAALTPATKVAGGTAWTNATANEIFDDIKALVTQAITQLGGAIDTEAKMTLALGSTRQSYFAATNSFNVNVSTLVKGNYPNMRIVTAQQYEALSAQNQQGNAAGNLMQLVVDEVEGQKTGFAAFAEKLRSHPLIRDLSSFRQKRSGGAWGTVLRMPAAVAQMVGI